MTSSPPPHTVSPIASGIDAPMIWVNGRPMRTGTAHLSALDRGFTLADGVFETMRVYGGVAFRLEDHLRRLRQATSALAIPLPSDIGDMVRAAIADASRTGLREAAVRVTVTRGVGAPGVAPPEKCEPTVVVTVTAPPAFPVTVYTAGISVHIASGRRNELAMTAGLKTIAYTDSVAALIEARAAGADDAFLLDTAGHLSEATSSNVFVHTGSALITPPLSCGVLPGITRATVMELAAELGMEIKEHPIQPHEMLAADEVFLTSSLRAIAPVVRVDRQTIGTGRPGPVTRRLTTAYAEVVRRDDR